MNVNKKSAKSHSGELKRKLTLTGNSKQLEAHVHTSLPPLVTGSLKGHVYVSLEGGIDWEYTIGPPAPKLCVRLKWWGEKSTGTIFRVPVYTKSLKKKTLGDCTTLAVYQVHSAWPQFKAYLQDMGSLTIDIGLGHMTDESMVIGQVVLPSLTKLSSTYPISVQLPVVNPKGLHLGKLNISFSVELTEQKTIQHRHKTTGINQGEKVREIPAEFVIGPSVGMVQSSTNPPDSDNSPDNQQMSPDVTRESFHKGSLYQQTPANVTQESNGSVHEDKDDVIIGPQQLGVISELIDRGKKLRNEMIHSLADGLPRPQDKDEEDQQYRETTCLRPLLLAELAQAQKEPPNSDFLESTDNVHELICLGISSDDDDDSIVLGLDDISVTEPDYPLHDRDLLSRLLYSGASERDQSISDVRNTKIKVKPMPSEEYVSQEDKDLLRGGEPEHSQPSAVDFVAQKATTFSTQAHVDTKKGCESEESIPTSKLTNKLSTSRNSEHRAGPKSNGSSLTTLSSYFSVGEKSLESAIVRSLGVENLTCLGRVTRARVFIETLELDSTCVDKVVSQRKAKRTESKQHRSQIPLSGNSSSTSTYFVEYQFPAALNGISTSLQSPSSTHHLTSHEVMRVASKKMVEGAVSFNHQSVFPVSFNSSVIQRWWNSTLIFRVYCRRPTERMPLLVGKAVVPLRVCLSSPSFLLNTTVEVRSSTLMDSVKDHVTDKDPLIGQLQVSIQLITNGKRHHTHVLGPTVGTPQTGSKGAGKTTQAEGGELEKGDLLSQSDVQTVKLKEPKMLAKTITPTPTTLQLLLLIPEAIGVATTSMSSTDLSHQGRLVLPNNGVPNCYLVCKLFCANPHPKTAVQWATRDPHFGFRQVYPLYLTPALLDQVCNNFTVIEVWHRTPGPNTDDELVGLVKVSLHQFYLAYSDKQAVQLCSESRLPVVAVDSYCPIVNPFSGSLSGHLALILALGTNEQINHLQQQFACGSYSLHKPYVQSNNNQSQSHTQQPHSLAEAPVDSHDGLHMQSSMACICHIFDVTVDGVRDLSAFNNTVWGEADCFVQYHFPTHLTGDDDPDLETMILQSYRTGTTLCVPNPSFSQSTRHTLTLPYSVLIQQELVRVCGRGQGERGCGLSGGVPFELWRRFYYPNIRDQLIAKATLPLVKLCAIVSMRKGLGTNIQTFSLQLRLVSEDSNSAEEGGVLDVTIKYEALSDTQTPVETEELKEDLNIEEKRLSDLEEEVIQEDQESPHKDLNDDNISQISDESAQVVDLPDSPSPVEEKQIPEDVFEARVIIHNALHLKCKHPTNAYVTLHPHPNVDKVSTPVVPHDEKPVWDYHCVTHIPNMYLQPQCSGLELQIWNQSSVPPLHSAPTIEHRTDDTYIGCAYVDLSTLAFGLRQISGWYNIVDFGGQVKGQLKVTVSPTQRISYPSHLLSYQLHTPPPSFVSKPSMISSTSRPSLCPSHIVCNEQGLALSVGEPAMSRTTSVLYQHLRDNIQELDTIHKSLQVKLGDIESSAPFCKHTNSQHTHTELTTTGSQCTSGRVINTSTVHSEQVHENISLSLPTSMSLPLAPLENSRPVENCADKNSDSGCSDVLHQSTIAASQSFTAMSPPPLTQVTNTPEVTSSLKLSPAEMRSDQIQSGLSYSQQDTASQCNEQDRSFTSHSSQSPDHSDQTVLQNTTEAEDDSYSLTDVSLTSEQVDVSQQTQVCNSTDKVNEETVIQTEILEKRPAVSCNNNEHSSTTVDSHHNVHLETLPSTNDQNFPLFLSSTVTSSAPTSISTASKALQQSQFSVSQPTATATSTSAVDPVVLSPDLESESESKSSYRFGQLPNFFMPPEELEESMRRLRASALARPPPRARQDTENKTWKTTPTEETHTSNYQGKTHSTLQDVHKYLDLGKVQRLSSEVNPPAVSSAETQRIARIFSSITLAKN